LRRADLEKQFGISTATAKRDLAAVRTTVFFDPSSDSYRMKRTPAQK
jgi:DeoR/GlpR family transcriptional regulator of sugar metabolism